MNHPAQIDGKILLFSAGNGSSKAEQLKKDIGYHQLLSAYTERKSIDKWVDYLRANPDCKCKLFIDSGAFTAHTKGVEVDVDDYINYVNSIDDCVFVFAQVDKIPGRFGQPKTAEELAEAPKLSWDNYLYMKDKVKSRDKLLPIFHQGEDFKWLRNMLEYKHEDGKHLWYIGISPANDVHVNEKAKWLEKVFKIIAQSSNPNVHTHAFGMTTLSLLEQYPFTSADSTSWVRSAGFGDLMIDGTSVYVSSRKVTDPKHINNRPPAIREAVEKRCEELGFTLDDILNDESGDLRALFNLASLKSWSDNYKYRGSTEFKEDLW